MTRILIAGAAGRMGLALIRCASHFKDLRVVAAIDKPGDPAIGKNAGALAGIGDTDVVIADNMKITAGAEVMVDFSFHTATTDNARKAADLGLGMVIGTTGLSDEETQAVKKASERIPIVWAPNMSLGVNVLFSLVSRAAEALGLRYDVEIIEAHHKHKKDAPSGTALQLAKEVAIARNQDLNTAAVYGRHGQTGARPDGQIAIHSVRMGDIVGDHTVNFSVDGERLELSHRATSRDAFAVGALRAAMWVARRKPGLYNMQDVLGLRLTSDFIPSDKGGLFPPKQKS